MTGKPASAAGPAGFLVSTRPLVRGLALAAILLGTFGCSESDDVVDPGPEVVRGSGVLAQEDRLIGGVTGVSISSIGDLSIALGAQEALRVEAEDNLLPYLDTTVQNGILRIRTQGNVDLEPTLWIEFHLTATTLDRIVHSGVGNVVGTNLTLNELTVTHTGVGEVRLPNLDVTQLNVGMSGVGNMEASGTAAAQDVTVSGIGDYEAENLSSVDADVLITGLGSATVRVSGTLDVTITGTGSVFYYGDPVLNHPGPGNVERLGP
jgi:hypothetical protein